MRTHTKEFQASLTPPQAFQLLKDGNRRFVSNLRLNRNLLQQVNETSEEQYPFAIVLSCIDSRTPAELIFDLGLGDIFSVRVAGNVTSPKILGSMEKAPTPLPPPAPAASHRASKWRSAPVAWPSGDAYRRPVTKSGSRNRRLRRNTSTARTNVSRENFAPE